MHLFIAQMGHAVPDCARKLQVAGYSGFRFKLADTTLVPEHLADRLVPKVGPPIEHYIEPLTQDEEAAYERELDAIEPAHAAAAARLRTLLVPLPARIHVPAGSRSSRASSRAWARP